MATQAEVRDLISHIRRTGYKVTKSGTKHYKVLKPNGAVLVDANGPLIISATPSETRWREMTVKRLIASGVFAADPYKKETAARGKGARRGEKPDGDKTARGANDEHLAAMREKSRQAIQAKSEEYKKRTLVVRGRVEPVIAKLGGWNTRPGPSPTGVTLTSFAETLLFWAERDARPELPVDTLGRKPTVAAASSASLTMRKPGETLGQKWLPLFEAFADYIEKDSGTSRDPSISSATYRDLVREMKGTDALVAAPPETDLETGLRELGRAPEPDPRPVIKVEPEAEPQPGPRVYEDEPVVAQVGLAYDEGSTPVTVHVPRTVYDALIQTRSVTVDFAEAPPIEPPTLALKTLYAIMRNRPVSPDEDATLALVSEIAALELNNPRQDEED